MANTNAMCGVKIYLDRMAEIDPAFALKYRTSGKTLRGAITYLAVFNETNDTNTEYRLKDLKATKAKCMFVDTNDDADNQLAYNYFMDDSLNYENNDKKESAPKKDGAPKKDVGKPKKEKPKKTEPSALSALSAMTVMAPATEDTLDFDWFD